VANGARAAGAAVGLSRGAVERFARSLLTAAQCVSDCLPRE